MYVAVGGLVLAQGSGVKGALQYLVLAFLGQFIPQEPWAFSEICRSSLKYHAH